MKRKSIAFIIIRDDCSPMMVYRDSRDLPRTRTSFEAPQNLTVELKEWEGWKTHDVLRLSGLTLKAYGNLGTIRRRTWRGGGAEYQD